MILLIRKYLHILFKLFTLFFQSLPSFLFIYYLLNLNFKLNLYNFIIILKLLIQSPFILCMTIKYYRDYDMYVPKFI